MDLKEALIAAKQAGVVSIEVDGIKFNLAPVKALISEVKESKAEEIVVPLSPWEDITDEELLYWSSGYYEQVMQKKEVEDEDRT